MPHESAIGQSRECSRQKQLLRLLFKRLEKAGEVTLEDAKAIKRIEAREIADHHVLPLDLVPQVLLVALQELVVQGQLVQGAAHLVHVLAAGPNTVCRSGELPGARAACHQTTYESV